jgi:hypothetical protein
MMNDDNGNNDVKSADPENQPTDAAGVRSVIG